MEIENRNTFEKYLKEGINLFTGSGFSILAEDRKKRPLPKGDELRQELLSEFKGAPSALGLPQLCTLLSRSRKADLDAYFHFRFDVDKFSDKYSNLAKINIKNIFTTNVDNLMESVFKDSSDKYINNANLNGVSVRDKLAIDYIYLHGSISDPGSSLVFGDIDIAKAFSSDPKRWNYLTSLMNKSPTLFWGYSLRDAGTLQVFADSLEESNKKKSWIIVHPDYISDGEVEYYQSLDLKIIKSNTEEFLDYLGSFSGLEEKALEKVTNPFPEHSIPKHADLQHRSIQDFYQGANPSWSDIYSPRVIKLKFYDEIENAINGRKNVLITGGPASGKTTLLMQLAAFHDFEGIKLCLSDIPKAKANTIAAKLGDIPAMLFVDNLQTSIEALNILSSKPNISLVIAERDYAYLSASNANFLRKNIKIVDITELDNADAQAVVDKIPADIKSEKRFQLRDGDSLFELIEKNCKTPSIRERFNNVISELRKKDGKLVELFLLVCYMHNCRSVASMDVIYNYFDMSYNSYQDLYKLLAILSSSISDYAGDLAEEEQDYFSIRSNLLAEHITSIAPQKDLALLLNKFHNNVPRYCVPSFDAFKRKGYDARLFERAFPNVDDGEEIYDVIYRKHQSPFNLQQKALYLSRRKEYEKAFVVIDEAIARSGSRIWSIKNTYAIIKFKANIEREDSLETRNALNESMEALEQCHSADVRKAFHAMKYSDHALSYWQRYRDEVAVQYLERSEKWLSEESDRDNRMQNVARLLQKVQKALSSAK
jgi:hypothetical protein